MKTLVCFVFISISVLVLVDAQGTPDDETPAQETICDLYKPIKGRLFGICNAYCEAMDCDSAAPKVVDSACFSVGHLLANTAADAFMLDPEDIDPNEVCRDSDGDGHPDFLDNCPLVSNPDQANSDTDSHGNACDNCPLVGNEDQLDSNGNGIGDACDDEVSCPCAQIYDEALDFWTNNLGFPTDGCSVIIDNNQQGYRIIFTPSDGSDSTGIQLFRSTTGALFCSGTIVSVDGNPFDEEILNITLEQAEACDALHLELCPP